MYPRPRPTVRRCAPPVRRAAAKRARPVRPRRPPPPGARAAASPAATGSRNGPLPATTTAVPPRPGRPSAAPARHRRSAPRAGPSPGTAAPVMRPGRSPAPSARTSTGRPAARCGPARAWTTNGAAVLHRPDPMPGAVADPAGPATASRSRSEPAQPWYAATVGVRLARAGRMPEVLPARPRRRVDDGHAQPGLGGRRRRRSPAGPAPDHHDVIRLRSSALTRGPQSRRPPAWSPRRRAAPRPGRPADRRRAVHGHQAVEAHADPAEQPARPPVSGSSARTGRRPRPARAPTVCPGRRGRLARRSVSIDVLMRAPSCGHHRRARRSGRGGTACRSTAGWPPGEASRASRWPAARPIPRPRGRRRAAGRAPRVGADDRQMVGAVRPEAAVRADGRDVGQEREQRDRLRRQPRTHRHGQRAVEADPFPARADQDGAGRVPSTTADVCRAAASLATSAT